jgi:Tol biopolymer transport system component
MLGWSPDSRYMSYILSDAAGSSLEIIKLEDDTLQSSKPRQDRKLPEGWRNASISPDGSRLFYITDRGLHLYTYIIDQSVLLFGNPSAYSMQIQPAWSPNGEWIALSYWETDASESPKLVLLQPDTCQVIQLDWSPSGWLSSWVAK